MSKRYAPPPLPLPDNASVSELRADAARYRARIERRNAAIDSAQNDIANYRRAINEICNRIIKLKILERK